MRWESLFCLNIGVCFLSFQPLGSGKRNAVRCAAARLGVSFVEIFGSVVAGFAGKRGAGTARTLEARIKGAFRKAIARGPSILYVRRFDQACRSSAQSTYEIRGQVRLSTMTIHCPDDWGRITCTVYFRHQRLRICCSNA